MLVLTRKKGQALMIGNDVELFVIDVQGDQVRIGIKAPKNITVHRKEVYDEIRNENVSAVLPAKMDIEKLNLKLSEKDGKQKPKENQ